MEGGLKAGHKLIERSFDQSAAGYLAYDERSSEQKGGPASRPRKPGRGVVGSEATPPRLSHALHSCPASPQGAKPIGWATASKGGAAPRHSGNKLAVWERGRAGGRAAGRVKASGSPGCLSQKSHLANLLKSLLPKAPAGTRTASSSYPFPPCKSPIRYPGDVPSESE